MQKNALNRFLAVLGLVLMGGGGLRADIASDSQKSAQWFSEQIGPMMAFQAASTYFLPGDTVGFPGVEAGVAGSIASSKLDVKGYKALPFNTLDNAGSQINLPKSIPLPAAVLHAKAGLPWGLDVGFQYGSLHFDDKASDAKTSFRNKIFGLSARKRFLGGGLTGVALPDLSVTLAFDNATGEATRGERYNGAVLGGGTLDADTFWKAKWNVNATTLRAVISKKLLIVTPFAGAGLTRISGTADTTVTNTVNASSFGAVSGVVTGSHKPKQTMAHVLAGVDLSILPFVRLNISALAAKDRWSASIGFRAQFP